MEKDTRVAWKRTAADQLDLKGWRIAVIGGTGGLGRALSRILAERGAGVTVVGQTFRDSDVAGIEFLQADLSLMREAKRVGDALPAESLDLVLYTTGIFAAPQRQVTPEGLERDMAVSFLSRLVLVRQMASRLGTSRPAERMKPRVFIMGYPGSGQAGNPDDLNAEKSYSAFPVHMNTVAGNEALVLDAVQRYPNVNVFGLNPGLIKTNIRSNFMGHNPLRFKLMEWAIGLFSPSPEQYGDRTAPLLVSPDLESHSGAMFDQKGNPVLPSAKLRDASYVARFIAGSEALAARVEAAPS